MKSKGSSDQLKQLRFNQIPDTCVKRRQKQSYRKVKETQPPYKTFAKPRNTALLCNFSRQVSSSGSSQVHNCPFDIIDVRADLSFLLVGQQCLRQHRSLSATELHKSIDTALLIILFRVARTSPVRAAPNSQSEPTFSVKVDQLISIIIIKFDWNI